MSKTKQLIEEASHFITVCYKELNKEQFIEERIKEIEQGKTREFIETLRDYEEIEKIYLEMVMTSTKELLLLFPTVNAFHRIERNELISSLKKIANRGVQVRILTPMDREIKISQYNV